MNDLFDRKQQELQSQQQQQAQVYQHADYEEEYLSAQRAAVEAIHVGRETLEVATQQGEQLNRAESIADETQNKLDKAARVLRGMTWSGWLANKLTKDVKPDATTNKGSSSSQRRQPPLVYDQDTLPVCARDVTQAIQNYHANINVLEACETEEQKVTCCIICDTMYQAAHKELSKFQNENRGMESYALEFALDFKILRERQLASQKRIRGLEMNFSKQRDELLELSSGSTSSTTSPLHKRVTSSSPIMNEQTKAVLKKQEIHLDAIAQSLGELGYIANSLSTEVTRQHGTIDALDNKGESILESTRMVTRRADRLIQKKSWTPTKPTYSCNVSIRHVATGKYLSVDRDNKSSLVLVSQYHPELCQFGIWKRQGTIFGMQNKDSRKWAGQSLLGQLACHATSFDRREEWEADCNGTPCSDFFSSKHVTNNVRLLLTSAGWGHGAYLIVYPDTHVLGIGGSSVEERKKADRWSITNLNYEEVGEIETN